MAALYFKDLTHVEVTKLWHDRETIFKNRSLDLSATDRIDSAGIAFLVQWAKSDSSKLKLENASNNIKAILTLYRVTELFDLA